MKEARRRQKSVEHITYRQAGYQVGSGSVEPGGKVVIQERMKQVGMRGSRDGAQAMLALCYVLLVNNGMRFGSPCSRSLNSPNFWDTPVTGNTFDRQIFMVIMLAENIQKL